MSSDYRTMAKLLDLIAVVFCMCMHRIECVKLSGQNSKS